MSPIPHDQSLASPLALLVDGYTYIGKRCQRYRSDLFETRLMLKKAVCVMGDEAAAVFYAPDRFTRIDAMPPTTLWLLQEEGSVQLLDGADHRQRKQMFMSLMTPAPTARLVEAMEEQWRDQLARWETQDAVVLDDEVREILCRAVCAWAGVPLSVPEAARRTRELGAKIDGAGTIGPRNWWGQWLRRRSERWARTIIDEVRAGKREVPAESAVAVIAGHRDRDGKLLETDEAAEELLNVLRPTVAVARFVTFAALALHDYPEHRQTVQSGDDELEWFVQEVRRVYPFFPFVGGRLRQAFDWRGYRFHEGTWVLLDLYGTNRDPRIWQDPDEFRPERFRHWDGSAFNFIPQGGGEHATGHRCPGEWIAIALMKRAVRLLTTAMRYDVPEQDLRIDLSRMPAVPQSRLVIANVQRVAETAAPMS